DIWVLDRQGRNEPLIQTHFDEMAPEFSPDGRWLAYTSNESGRDEVYVRPFPGPGHPIQVSTTGGQEPYWSPDGREILYTYPNLELKERAYYTAQIKVSGEKLRPDLPERLFGGTYTVRGPVRGFDVGPDGRMLLVKWDWLDIRTQEREDLAPTHIELVTNWFQELRARVPVD
ncbi:MAG: hypothetical protein P8Y94_15385, partial [Acidobacteriota bacterium]